MKKWIALMLAMAMLLCTMTGCGDSGDPGNSDNPGGDETEVKKIAVICDPVGVNPFLTQIVDKFEEVKTAGTYPMDYSVVECADDTAWSENIRASVEEGYDFILVVGWQGADPLNEVATQFPDKAQYAIIDTTCDNENVKSYIFKPQEDRKSVV